MGMGLLGMSAWMLYHCVGISSSLRKKRFCLLILLLYVYILGLLCSVKAIHTAWDHAYYTFHLHGEEQSA